MRDTGNTNSLNVTTGWKTELLRDMNWSLTWRISKFRTIYRAGNRSIIAYKMEPDKFQ